jgi:RNA polymerase sigma-70 factor (ECF subfamily)
VNATPADGLSSLLPASVQALLSPTQRAALDQLWHTLPTYPAVDVASFATRLGHLIEASQHHIDAITARLADLWLTHGAGAGDATALAELDTVHLRRIPEYLAQLRLAPADVADVQQHVRQRLCTTDADANREPVLWQYTARADLAGWLRVIALREGLALKRRNAALTQRHQRAAVGEITVADPVLRALKTKYRDEFRRAFAAAMQQLDPQARSILRLQVIEQLTLDQIGQALRVHAATASRWLSQARADLHRLTCAQLANQLQLGDDDVESAMRLIASELDASVSRVLGEKSL